MSKLQSLNFPVLNWEAADAKKFIDFWSGQYDSENDGLYDQNIRKPVTEESLLALFEWKNGSVLSKAKRRSIQRYLNPAERISATAGPDELKSFLCSAGGVIWRIFWLHIQHPLRFPIYDQHVYRAMLYLKGLPPREIDSHDDAKADSYLKEYLPFITTMGDVEIRKLDRAMWSFGRFLSFGYRFAARMPKLSNL